MPKIIENVKEKLLEEARRQVMEQSYSAMTIRSVASACGVGVGTVYNYFSSKDMLIASFMLEDWMRCIEEMEVGATNASEAKDALFVMYKNLRAFIDKYSRLFVDEGAEKSFSVSASNRHLMLREQLAKPMLVWTKKQERVDPEFLAEFIAESMLTWTMSGANFEPIAATLLQLL